MLGVVGSCAMPIPWEAIAPRTRAPTAVRILDDHVGAGPHPLLLREGTRGPPIAHFHSTVIVVVAFVPPVTNIQAARALVEPSATRVDSLPASLLWGGGDPPPHPGEVDNRCHRTIPGSSLPQF